MDNSKAWTFDNVNKSLGDRYRGSDIEVWDDLWFWGFITQKGSGDNREFEREKKWNENKYWALRETDKNQKVIEEIKERSEKFLKILAYK
ncbi:hypothetical protein FQZ97_981650 [compost metagenome]